MLDPAVRSWLRPILKPLWPTFCEILALSFFVNLLALAVPVFVMQIYDRVIFHAGLATLQGLVIGILCVLVFDWVLRQSRARILQRVALRLDVSVGRSLFDKVLTLPLAALEARPAAYWHALFRDVDIVRNALSGAAALMICDLPFAVLFLFLTFMLAQPGRLGTNSRHPGLWHRRVARGVRHDGSQPTGTREQPAPRKSDRRDHRQPDHR